MPLRIFLTLFNNMLHLFCTILMHNQKNIVFLHHTYIIHTNKRYKSTISFN